MNIPTEMKQKGDLKHTQIPVDKHMPSMRKPEPSGRALRLAEFRFGFNNERWIQMLGYKIPSQRFLEAKAEK